MILQESPVLVPLRRSVILLDTRSCTNLELMTNICRTRCAVLIHTPKLSTHTTVSSRNGADLVVFLAVLRLKTRSLSSITFRRCANYSSTVIAGRVTIVLRLRAPVFPMYNFIVDHGGKLIAALLYKAVLL